MVAGLMQGPNGRIHQGMKFVLRTIPVLQSAADPSPGFTLLQGQELLTQSQGQR